MKRRRIEIDDRGHLLTEKRNRDSRDLDALTPSQAFDLMNAKDQSVPRAVARAKPAIVKTIKRVAAAWRDGGRLIYVGAGTSGRLGVLDAAELQPPARRGPQPSRRPTAW